jgi:hypothetical protein
VLVRQCGKYSHGYFGYPFRFEDDAELDALASRYSDADTAIQTVGAIEDWDVSLPDNIGVFFVVEIKEATKYFSLLLGSGSTVASPNGTSAELNNLAFQFYGIATFNQDLSEFNSHFSLDPEIIHYHGKVFVECTHECI